MMLWTWMYKYLFENLFLILLYMHPEEELLDHMVVLFLILWGAPILFSGLSGEEFTCDAEDTGDEGSIPGSGRSPGGGHGNPLQYSCLENPMDKEPGGYSPQDCKDSDKTEVTEHAWTHSFSQWFHHFTFPATLHKGSNFSTSLPTHVLLFFCYSSHPNGCEIVSHCSFDLHFPNN